MTYPSTPISYDGAQQTFTSLCGSPWAPQTIAFVRDLVRESLTLCGSDPVATNDACVAVTEACANAVEHVVGIDEYDVTIDVTPELLHRHHHRPGQGVTEEAASARMPGPDVNRGRGIPLMRVVMDEVIITIQPDVGTTVQLVKLLTEERRNRRLITDRPRRRCSRALIGQRRNRISQPTDMTSRLQALPPTCVGSVAPDCTRPRGPRTGTRHCTPSSGHTRTRTLSCRMSVSERLRSLSQSGASERFVVRRGREQINRRRQPGHHSSAWTTAHPIIPLTRTVGCVRDRRGLLLSSGHCDV